MLLPTTTQFLTFFNLFIGVMLSISMILFFGGFVMYLVRLGTWPTYRETAVSIMKWGVTTLFALIIILGVQQFLLKHLAIAATIGALIIIGFVAWVFMYVSEEPPKPAPEAGRR